jgi:hypothetical protein
MAFAVNFNTYAVQVINSAIAVYNRQGVLQPGFPKSLGAFFPGSTGDVGDPRAFYDSYNKRFVIVADDFTGGIMYLAASQTDNPTGAWNIYSFNPWGPANCRASGAACADFPMIGFDNNYPVQALTPGTATTIYLGVNFFDAAGQVHDYMLLLPKTTIYSGGGFSYNYWYNLSIGGQLVDTVQPVVMTTTGEHPRAGFAVNTFNGNCAYVSPPCNGLAVWAFSNNLVISGSPGPEISAVVMPTRFNYSLPPGANEPGYSFGVDTGDVRISGTPIYHTGLISGSFNTAGSDGLAHLIWFQLRPILNDNDARCTGTFANACPQIISAVEENEDCFLCGGQGNRGSSFYGTLAAADNGDLTMVFEYSDLSTYPESAYTSRRVTQSPNVMHDSGIVMCGGSSAVTNGRWGDYTAAQADVGTAAETFLWFSGQNTGASGSWSTCVGANAFTVRTQP